LSPDLRDPIGLDRELARVARAWAGWRRQLAMGEGLDQDPFVGARELTGRATFTALSELDPTDPLRAPLMRWVYRLMEQRIDAAVLCAIASERSVERHVIEEPQRDRVTLAELLRRALDDPARHADWLASFIPRCDRHSAAVALAWERRQEMALRLGLDEFDALDPDAARIVASAQRWLDASDALAAEWRTHSLSQLVGTALASEAIRGWPARLTLRTLADFFRETRLLDGLVLEPGPLPPALAPASFLRGLARLGVAFSDALAPRALPFAIAFEPRGLRRRTLGATFAAVALGPAFSRRALGLGADAARTHARALWRAVLLESRAQALRVIVRAAALSGRSALETTFEEQAERVFGVHVPRVAAGSLWRLHVDDPQRFAAIMLGALRVERLIEQHDEDWFRNPRAADQLRSETSLPPESALEGDALDAGRSALLRRLTSELA
jgi:hypothetical protein